MNGSGATAFSIWNRQIGNIAMTEALLLLLCKLCLFIYFFSSKTGKLFTSLLNTSLYVVVVCLLILFVFRNNFIGGWLLQTNQFIRSVYVTCSFLYAFPRFSIFFFISGNHQVTRLVSTSAWKSVTIKFCQVCSLLLLLRQRLYTFFLFSHRLFQKMRIFPIPVHLSTGKYAMCQFSLGTFNIVYLY